MRDHAARKNGGWRGWAGAVLGGVAIAAAGLLIVRYVPSAPWWAAVLFFGVGVQTATRGALLAGLVPLKDMVIEVLRAKKE